MKFKLPPSPLHVASCFHDPAAGRMGNINNMEAGPSTAASQTASPAHRMLGMLSPAWAKKAIREYSSPKKEHVPQWTPAPQWEPESLLVSPERGEDLLKNLKLHEENFAEGHFGSISIFENKNGERIVGKFIKAEEDISKKELSEKEFFREFDAFKTLYEHEKAGRHPNLVNMYGIASMVDKEGNPTRAMLMDSIPGISGKELFDELRSRLNANDISYSTYLGIFQFFGRRMFDVIGHINNAEVVHNDIKPDNFRVHEETGEPILIDLGGWSWKDDPAQSISEAYASPEARIGYGVDEKSDTFGGGATLLYGVEGGDIEKLEEMPNRGLREEKEHRKDEDGNIVRQPRTYAVTTAYPDFMNNVLQNNREKRFTAEEAKNHPFLDETKTLLKDGNAKEIISNILKDVKEKKEKLAKENEKSQKYKQNSFNKHIKQSTKKIKSRLDKTLSFPEKHNYSPGTSANLASIKRDFKSLRENPNLHTYANLQSFGKNNPEVMKYLEKQEDKSPELKQEIERSMIPQATAYIAQADWFEHAKSIFEKEVPTLPVKIPVKSGVRGDTEGNSISPKYAADVYKAKEKFSPYAYTQTLKDYVKNAEDFLRKARTLKRIENQETNEKIEQVRERMELASRVLEIFELTSASSEIHEILDRDAAKEAAKKGVLMSQARMETIEKSALMLQEKMEKKKTEKKMRGQMKAIYNAYNDFKRGTKNLK